MRMKGNEPPSVEKRLEIESSLLGSWLGGLMVGLSYYTVLVAYVEPQVENYMWTRELLNHMWGFNALLN
jgi:hypothetical protein